MAAHRSLRAFAPYVQSDRCERGALHQHCVQLYDAMISTDATKERVRNIDCDPKQAVEAAAVIALGGRIRAVASRFEQSPQGWRCTTVRIL